jgi:hypothetical protein
MLFGRPRCSICYEYLPCRCHSTLEEAGVSIRREPADGSSADRSSGAYHYAEMTPADAEASGFEFAACPCWLYCRRDRIGAVCSEGNAIVAVDALNSFELQPASKEAVSPQVNQPSVQFVYDGLQSVQQEIDEIKRRLDTRSDGSIDAEATVANREDCVSAVDLRRAIEPIASWYDVDGEEGEPMTMVEVIAEACTTLVAEREDNLRMRETLSQIIKSQDLAYASLSTARSRAEEEYYRGSEKPSGLEIVKDAVESRGW